MDGTTRRVSHSSSKKRSDDGLPKSKRKKAKRACSSCQRAHFTCGDERPCGRCLVRGLGPSCQDIVRWVSKPASSSVLEAATPTDPASNHAQHSSSSYMLPHPEPDPCAVFYVSPKESPVSEEPIESRPHTAVCAVRGNESGPDNAGLIPALYYEAMRSPPLTDHPALLDMDAQSGIYGDASYSASFGLPACATQDIWSLSPGSDMLHAAAAAPQFGYADTGMYSMAAAAQDRLSWYQTWGQSEQTMQDYAQAPITCTDGRGRPDWAPHNSHTAADRMQKSPLTSTSYATGLTGNDFGDFSSATAGAGNILIRNELREGTRQS